MTSSFQSERIPAIIKGHRHFSYGGAVLPESVTIEQYYDLTPTKKSNLRLNDQLLPKPTDIDMSKRMIKSVIPKEHPYQSHISRYAMFPSYESPDDHHTGVRAASTLPLNPLLPSSAPAVTVLHKTKGSPYRHEMLDVPMATRGEGIVWPGQCGFQNHTKPSKGETQVIYPKPMKTVYPNATLRNSNITLSEHSANMLRNLEKAHWFTSYQLHYTGTGPTNPIKLDDFNEKTIAMLTGEMNPLTTQLMERSVPTFIPSRPLEGRKTRDFQYRHALESTYAPSQFPLARSGSADLDLSPSHKLGVEVRKQNITVHKSAQGKDHVPHNLFSDACKSEQVTESNQSYEDARSGPVSGGSTPGHCEICKKRMCLCGSELHVGERHQTTKSQPEKENEYLSKNLRPRSFKEAGKKSLHNWTDLQPRCTVLELQDSFSKSEAHRRLHETTKVSKTDLRDNHHAGRKHSFCGFNSYYFHN